MKKYAMHFLFAFLIGVLRAFVLMYVWNWFISEVFHVSEVSFLKACGLSLVIQLFTGDSSSGQKFQWKWLMKTLEFCVAEDRKDALKEARNSLEEGLSQELTSMILSEFLSLISIFVIGFGIHVLVG